MGTDLGGFRRCGRVAGDLVIHGLKKSRQYAQLSIVAREMGIRYEENPI